MLSLQSFLVVIYFIRLRRASALFQKTLTRDSAEDVLPSHPALHLPSVLSSTAAS